MNFVQILEKDDASSTLPESAQIVLLMDFRNEALPLSLHLISVTVLFSAIYIEMLVMLLRNNGTRRDMDWGGHVKPFIISLSRSVFQRKSRCLIFHM